MIFNFYDLFRFKVYGKRETGLLSKVFSSFRVSEDIPVDLELDLTRFRIEDPYARKRIKQNIFVDDSTLYLKGSYKGVSWWIKIGLEEGQTFRVKFFSSLFIEELALRMVILPVFQLVVGQKGHNLLICSIFLQNKIMKMIMGMPGSGKTSVLLEGCNHNAQFFIDDYALISREGQILRIKDTVSLRPSLVLASQYIRSRVVWSDKLSAFFWKLIEVITRGSICFHSSLRVDDIFPSITSVPKGEAIKVFYLEKSFLADREYEVIELGRQGLIQRILLYEQANSSWHGDILGVYQNLNPADSLVKRGQVLRENLECFFTRSQCYLVKLRTDGKQIMQKVGKKILEI
ncbi:MAG: hypothetical protein JSU92_11435 [Deltaproteobacteria bacterium]|nr:MAG: hypothetical protein JSU92_11435 [Deltaproteobacteria bacterium]